MKEVTIVIPNYNGKKFMADCLDSLKTQTYKDFDILVIDNASEDGSVAFMKENYPEIRVEVMKENLGFAGGVNVGIKMVKTPYVILLNNDTAVDKDYVKELVKSIKRNPRIFSVSPRMIQMYDKELIDDAGDLYTVMGWAAQKGVGQKVEKYAHNGRIFTACGGAPIYRMSALKKIGLFDELHFAYLEDIDLGFRAKLYGYTNVYSPKAIVYHVGSGTSGSRYNSFKVKLAARNSVYVNYKNMATWMKVVNGPALIAGHLIKIRFFKNRGFGKDYIDGLKEGFKTAGKCKKAYSKAGFIRQLAIEGELIICTVIYFKEFVTRQINKVKNS